MSESWPPRFARLIAAIISSDLPGEMLGSAPRYARIVEAMHFPRTLLYGDPIVRQGEFRRLTLEPPRMTAVSGRCPPVYIDGLSEPAREAAAGADLYLI